MSKKTGKTGHQFPPPPGGHAASSVTKPSSSGHAPGPGTPSDHAGRVTPAQASELVLSLFPGVDLLGRGFESAGFCVVRGPDTLLDSRIEHFRSPPAGHLDGIIGGPPCQNYSDANRNRNQAEGDRLVRQFLRVIDEARPQWFLMENVRRVPDVRVEGYTVQRLGIFDSECGGKQKRLRHIQFGSLVGDIIRPERTESSRSVTAAVMCRASKSDRHSRRLSRQSASDLPLRSLTKAARDRVIGNAVPLTMAKTLGHAVRCRSVITETDCACGCGRTINPARQKSATASCRKRLQRKRDGNGRAISPT